MVRLTSSCVALTLLVCIQGCGRKDAVPQEQAVATENGGALARGKDASSQKKWAEAIAQFSQVLNHAPHDVDALYQRGVAYKEQCSELGHKVEQEGGRTAVFKAVREDALRAVADFTKVLEINPKHGQALVARAEVRRRWLEEFVNAIADCDAALAQDARNAEALFQRGSAFAEKTDSASLQRALADLDEFVPLAPKDFRGYASRGHVFRDLREFHKSLADFSKALELRPDDMKLLFFRGMAYAALGQFANAQADLDRLAQRPEKLARIVRLQGLFAIFANEGKLDQAVQAVDLALAIDEKLAAYLLPMRFELIYHTRKDYAKVIEDCTRLVAIDPDGGDGAHYWRAVCLCHLGRFEAALPDFAQAIKRKPDHAEAYRNRAIAYFNLARDKEVLADSEACLRLLPKQGDMHALRAWSRKREGQLDAALADYNEALALGFCHAGVYLDRGEIYFLQNKRDLALKDLSEAIRLAPKTDYLYQTRALIHLAMGDKDKACADYAESARLNPRDVLPASMISLVSGSETEVQQALDRLEKDVPNESERKADWYFQCSALWMSVKQWDKGLANCQRALELDPKNVSARSNRVGCYLCLRDYDKAIADGNQVLAVAPESADAWSNRGLCYLGKKDYAKALADMNEAIKLAPRHGQWYENRAVVWTAMGEPLKALEDRAKARELSQSFAVGLQSNMVSFAVRQEAPPPPLPPLPPPSPPVELPPLPALPIEATAPQTPPLPPLPAPVTPQPLPMLPPLPTASTPSAPILPPLPMLTPPATSPQPR